MSSTHGSHGIRTVTVLLLGVLALAGCGQRAGGDPPPGNGSACPAAPETLDPPIPALVEPMTLPDGVREVPAKQVDSSALPDGYESDGEVWVFDGGCSLQTFAMASSGCSGTEAEILDQSADAVRIELRSVKPPPDDDRSCTMALEPQPVAVRLAEPLGDRTVRLVS